MCEILPIVGLEDIFTFYQLILRPSKLFAIFVTILHNGESSAILTLKIQYLGVQGHIYHIPIHIWVPQERIVRNCRHWWQLKSFLGFSASIIICAACRVIICGVDTVVVMSWRVQCGRGGQRRRVHSLHHWRSTSRNGRGMGWRRKKRSFSRPEKLIELNLFFS